jgi:hypothetical protein
MHAASHTNELPEQCALSLNATADSKLQPLRHPSVDARQQLREVSSELFLALGGWTLDEHTAIRVVPPNDQAQPRRSWGVKYN